MGGLAASFFFDRGSASRSKITGFIPTIAYQLSISVPSTKPLMQSAIQLDPSIPDQTHQYQLKKLVIDPLLTLRELIPPKVIVVDALDQCDGEDCVKDLITLLADGCRDNRLPLRFCLTGQAEDWIQALFEDSPVGRMTYFLALEEFDAHDDIRTFFQVQLRSWRSMRNGPRPWPSSLDLDRLVAKSSGLFIIASTIVKFVNDGSDLPHQRLQTALEMNDVEFSAVQENVSDL